MSHRPRILAVDDDAMNREILAELLEEDYDVTLAESGEDCLELAGKLRPDLILLDIMMPGIDGYETTRRIRQNPGLRHTKVALVSAKAMLPERLEGYEAGADDYIVKPFHGAELTAKVAVLLRLRSAEEVDDLKSQFLHLLSHETRTPLTGIVSPASLLRELLSGDEEAVQLVDMIIEGGRRLEEMINSTLELCEIRTGETNFSPAPLDLVEVLQEVVSESQELAAERSQEIGLAVPGQLPIEGDRGLVSRAMHALVRNALLCSPPGETVDVNLDTTDGWASLRVTDAAPVSEDWTPHVFRDFFVPDVNHHGQLALDLAVCAGIVRLHGGDVDADLTQSTGSTLSVRLPLANEPSSGPETVAEAQVLS